MQENGERIFKQQSKLFSSQITAQQESNRIQEDELSRENKIFEINNKKNCNNVFSQHRNHMQPLVLPLNNWGFIRVGRFKQFNNVHWSNDIFFRWNKVVIPLSLRYKVAKDFRVAVNHPGTTQTLAAVAQQYVCTGTLYDWLLCKSYHLSRKQKLQLQIRRINSPTS